ncbi:MAG: thioredoxin family protein [Candidatus Limnocylindrales bacterium]
MLGPGCANCKRLEANAREAVVMDGIEAEVVKVTDCGQSHRGPSPHGSREVGAGPDYRRAELAPPARSMSASWAAPSRPRSARATAK